MANASTMSCDCVGSLLSKLLKEPAGDEPINVDVSRGLAGIEQGRWKSEEVSLTGENVASTIPSVRVFAFAPDLVPTIYW